MAYYNNSHSSSRPNYQGQGGSRQSYQNQFSPENFMATSLYSPTWITNGADEQLPKFAEKMGKAMADQNLTNSKIRSIYGEIKRIQVTGFEREKPSFYLLRPKVAYALGRDPHNNGLKLFKLLFDKASQSVTDTRTYKNFCNLMEAVLAYHKANGGKD